MKTSFHTATLNKILYGELEHDPPGEGQYYFVAWNPADLKMTLYRGFGATCYLEAERPLCGHCHDLDEALEEMKLFLESANPDLGITI